MFALLLFFLSPFGGLLDAVSLEFTTAAGFKYGPMRIMGSLAFGAFSLILSLILTLFQDYTDVRIIFPAYVLIAAGAVIAVKMMPGVAGHARGKASVSYKDFFKDKACVTLLIFMFVAHFTFGCYVSFMQNFLDGQNNPSWVWGLAVFFSIVFEIFFFWKFEYFFRRFKIKHIVIFCTFTQVLRYISFAFLPSAAMILVTSLLTGSFATVVHYAAAYYINLTVSKEMRALGQTLMCSISFYIPRFLAGILGGFVVQNYSFAVLMQICAIINILLILSARFLSFREPVDK
jgi:PPP family 3-phenylpropionic acid transporter